MTNEIVKGCHTCILNDVFPLKTCKRLQKESTFLHCPNWEEVKTGRDDEMLEEMLDIMKSNVAQIIFYKKM